ncbi:putative hydantoin racemase [Haloferax prahovense DSM 18310]|uniref:Hydantoin racemase n=1 Tax=Haloferax prahovense (strain DSM 18310 / JCM 13924 / TL6) TaxID=1227461 RepID=M0G1A1_HALPT|nr:MULTISPECIES: aspartate/glutamate racemase family protein [Haloferax]ELZ65348.1 putative hydantoin racemase [Haloferax prahovense DSM 18310]RDZ48559.1 hydantoin racemase [Haloferax sp. Atlit-19N]
MVELGVLRVLTLDDPEEVALHGRLIERHYPHVSTLSRCIPAHPDGIPNAAAEADALPHIEALGREMATEVDALCVSCALDPGVEALGDALDVPVVGAGASVAAVASARGERVGTLGLENGAGSSIRHLLGDRLAAEEVVEGAATTNYLTTDEGRAAIRAAVDRLVDAGCDVVAPSCTGISSSGAIPDVRADVPIPIVDPVVAMGAVATTAVAPPRPLRQ